MPFLSFGIENSQRFGNSEEGDKDHLGGLINMYVNMICLGLPLQFPKKFKTSQSTHQMGAFYLSSPSQSIAFTDAEEQKSLDTVCFCVCPKICLLFAWIFFLSTGNKIQDNLIRQVVEFLCCHKVI